MDDLKKNSLPLSTAADIAAIDNLTCAHQKITSLELMERAGNACVLKLCALFPQQKNWLILAGDGNNGGDGLVIARQLFMRGHCVLLFHSGGENCSSDNRANLQRVQKLLPILPLQQFLSFENKDFILIDALFGVGINRPLHDIYAQVVQHGNKLALSRVAIDLPSGLIADKYCNDINILRCDHTLCLGAPKEALLWQEHECYVGKLHLLPINLSSCTSTARAYWLDASAVAALWQKTSAFAHKGTTGALTLMVGSKRYVGAAILAAQAALKMGVGLLYVHAPLALRQTISLTLAEAILSFDTQRDFFGYELKLNLDKTTAFGVGCGIGTHAKTQTALIKTLQNCAQIATVIDADALNILAQQKHWQQLLPQRAILTPHPKEFARLSNKTIPERERRIDDAREMAINSGAVVVLKGKYSIIASPNGDVFINPTGNSALACGGSGDVLTGMIAALLASGYSPIKAAILGVYIHGLTADILQENEVTTALSARELLRGLVTARNSIANFDRR